MEILFTKSKWEVPDISFDHFLKRTQESGFDGIECSLMFENKTAEEVLEANEKYRLKYVGFIWTGGETPQEQLEHLEQQFIETAKCSPILINLHTGRDIFSFEENLRIFHHAFALGEEYGIRVVVETHRSRPTYSAIETRRYLEAFPELRLNADFSHWMVVHESDLSDQPENVNLAIERCDHIHARVGFEEGPQVTDPRAPEWKDQLSNHLNLWRKIFQHHRNRGSEFLTITPEFGPFPYVHTLPFTNQPVADVWEINVYMKDLLQTEIGYK